MFYSFCFIYLSVIFLTLYPNRTDTLISSKGGDMFNSLSGSICGNRLTVPIEIYDKCFAPFDTKLTGKRAIEVVLNTHPYDWPWFVNVDLSLFKTSPDLTHCGGAIITDYWIITAAYCFEHLYWIPGSTVEKEDYHKVKIHTFGKYPQTFDVEDIKYPDGRIPDTNIGHGKPRNWRHDLALIKTSKPMDSFGITNVCLRDSDNHVFERRVTFLNLINTTKTGQSFDANQLKEIAFFAKECVRTFYLNCSAWECLCHTSPGNLSLNIGGPLMIGEYSNKYKINLYNLVGILSGVQHYSNQIMFTNIWPFIKWIKDVTGQ